jgi:hypothetical protein
MKLIAILLIAALGYLAYSNPTETDFRAHLREEQGFAATLGLALTDLLSSGPRGGIQRENFVICSRFYVGGDGVLPRQDLAWGVGGQFFDIAEKKDIEPLKFGQ